MKNPNLTQDKLHVLQDLHFPERPEDERLADWILNLAEMDGHYVGVAVSLLAGERIGIGDGSDIEKALVSLEEIRPAAPSDKAIQARCRLYVHALRDLVLTVRDAR